MYFCKASITKEWADAAQTGIIKKNSQYIDVCDNARYDLAAN